MQSIEVNAADPAGDEPPDELFYRPDDDVEISLCRRSAGRGPWLLSVYKDGKTQIRSRFDSFESGFAMLASWTETYPNEVPA